MATLEKIKKIQGITQDSIRVGNQTYKNVFLIANLSEGTVFVKRQGSGIIVEVTPEKITLIK